MGSGVVLMLAGNLLLSNMEWPLTWRAVLSAIWILDCGITLRRLATGWAHVSLIMFDSDGGVRTKNSMGETIERTLQSGSFVLARIAWFRLKDGRGGVYSGLFIQCRMDADDWHRLQLLWQQSRQVFGHPAGP